MAVSPYSVISDLSNVTFNECLLIVSPDTKLLLGQYHQNGNCWFRCLGPLEPCAGLWGPVPGTWAGMGHGKAASSQGQAGDHWNPTLLCISVHLHFLVQVAHSSEVNLGQDFPPPPLLQDQPLLLGSLPCALDCRLVTLLSGAGRGGGAGAGTWEAQSIAAIHSKAVLLCCQNCPLAVCHTGGLYILIHFILVQFCCVQLTSGHTAPLCSKS